MQALDAIRKAGLYARTVARVAPRGLRERGGDPELATERVVFVVGSPRSGTTFLAGAVGAQPGHVDLGEVKPMKANVDRWMSLGEEEAARELRSILERVRRLAFVRDLRPVEQTPELSFVLRPAVRAYPRSTVLHIVRDGRDVVSSLLAKGWLREREGHDDARKPFGVHPRAWVEAERREEFTRAREAARAAWAWRRYVSAARAAAPDHTLEVRYEDIAADPEAAATLIAARLETDPQPLAEALAAAHGRSVGRWRWDLTAEQVADIEGEAGMLLRELGYS